MTGWSNTIDKRHVSGTAENMKINSFYTLLMLKRGYKDIGKEVFRWNMTLKSMYTYKKLSSSNLLALQCRTVMSILL